MSHPFLAGPFPRAFAHRGWHLDELTGMENSLAAFRRAVQEGYRYLETDVRATRDGEVVVIHDATLDRTTDGSGPVARQPWSAVRRARVGGREPLSLLTDVLEELPQALLNIDVKAGCAVEPVLRVLQRTDAWHRVCLASFSEARLRRLRRLAGPKLLTSMGTASAAALRARSSVQAVPLLRRVPVPIGGRLAQLPVTYAGIRVLDPALVGYAHRHGWEVHVWTVDHAEQMEALLDLGADGLVTDRPDVLREVLRGRGVWPGADAPIP